MQYAGPLEPMPVERWEQDIAVNLSACFHLPSGARHARAQLGRIVNVSSSQGLVGSGWQGRPTAALQAWGGRYGEGAGPGVGADRDHRQRDLSVGSRTVRSWCSRRERAAAGGRERGGAGDAARRQPTSPFVGESDVGALIALLCSDGRPTRSRWRRHVDRRRLVRAVTSGSTAAARSPLRPHDDEGDLAGAAPPVFA